VSLSFELGMPLQDLRRMPQADLQQYLAYAERHGLPAVRTEMLLAQVALVMAQLKGVQGVKLADFLQLLQPPPDEVSEEIDPEQAAEQVAALVGFRPRRLNATPQTQKTDGKQTG
jgi:hypothetical protein